MAFKTGQILLTPNGIKYSIIGFCWLTFLWTPYLSYRQYKVVKETTRVPSQLVGVLDQETMDKSRSYNLDKMSYDIAYGIWKLLIMTFFIYFNFFPYLWSISGKIVSKFLSSPGEIVQSIVWSVLASLVSEVLFRPLVIYSNFVVEERHGFNKYTAQFYAVDQSIKFVVTQIIMALIIAATVYITRTRTRTREARRYYFFYLWVFVSFVIITIVAIWPNFIAPLFDTFTPLPDGELKTKVEKLASSVDFPVTDIYVVHYSKRSSHSGAYVTGLNKRIVLLDTLIQGYEKEGQDGVYNRTTSLLSTGKKDLGFTVEEVIALVGHELGHWKLNHILQILAAVEVYLLIVLSIFGFLVHNDRIYQAFGFKQGVRPVFVGLILILNFIFAPSNELFVSLFYCLLHRLEFQADAFFVSIIHNTRDLREACIKLYQENLVFPVYDSLYSQFRNQYPSILERLEALGE